jgi:hypothetical protein
MKSYHLSVLLALALAGSIAADVLDDIKPGEWFEAPNSKLSSVSPNPPPPGNTGVSSVMEAWSGGSYDTKRDRLIVWGGGHGDYSGNEVYVYDIKLLKWVRVNDPSKNVGGDEQSGIYPDSTPRSRHTYNYVQYVPSIDRFCTFGGAAMYPTGATGTSKTHCFDFDTKTWTSPGNTIHGGIGTISAVDENGNVWVQAGGQNGPLSQWDPVKNVWTKQSIYFKGWFDYLYTGAIGSGKFVAIGDGNMMQWDLGNPKADPKEIPTTGENKMVSVKNPGFVYDSKLGFFVAWNGGTDVYVYSPGSRQWIKAPLASTNKVTPTAASPAGTYGRFQYIPSKDLFIGVNSIKENVFFYRLPAKLELTNEVRHAPPLNGKLEIHILGGLASRSISQTLFLGEGLGGGDVSCKIFSAQSELLYDKAVPVGSAEPITLQLASARDAAFSGNYFLQVLQDRRVLLTRRLDLVK